MKCVLFIYLFLWTLCRDAGYIELIVSVQERRCKSPPTQKTDWSTKQDRAIGMLSLSQTCAAWTVTQADPHALTPSCARYMISYTNAVTLVCTLACAL